MRKTLPQLLAFVFLCLSLTGCGFQPLYADKNANSSASFNNIELASIVAVPTVQDVLARAYQERKALSNKSAPEYVLSISARENAQRLAVQIDASVTRYNYALQGKYTLVRTNDGKRQTGNVSAVASFNVVTSQYSTLFAENAAREKAARSLIEKIEREILLTLSDPESAINANLKNKNTEENKSADEPSEPAVSTLDEQDPFDADLDVEYIQQ